MTGTKMATRIGNVKEFEFKTIGENHSQGVSFCSASMCSVTLMLKWSKAAHSAILYCLLGPPKNMGMKFIDQIIYS